MKYVDRENMMVVKKTVQEIKFLDATGQALQEVQI